MMKFLSTPARRDLFFLFLMPFTTWIICFWKFLSGRMALTLDAVSYYDHIGYFTDNLIRGVYPLWNPAWLNGAPNNFFLRRIGEFNPFYWIVGGLKAFGVSQLHAYLTFLTVYYFLGMLAFWLIARILFRDRITSTAACFLLLFSAWGSQLFYNYIIILFTPLVWFFYFLFAFYRQGKRHQFLGIFFTLAIVVTTYIPFFFMTVALVFAGLFTAFFWKEVTGFLGRIANFFKAHRVFAPACVAFFLVACIPAIDFYHESKQGEFSLPGRHTGSADASEITVGVKIASSGDIVTHSYFDKMLFDHKDLGLEGLFIPYFFFIVFLVTALNPFTRRTAFILMNILVLGAISITESSPLHKFLYDHVFFFKFMRNIYYFFWLAVLPMIILLVAEQLRIFLKQYRGKPGRMVLVFVVMAHLVFGGWALAQERIAWTSWIAVGLSLAFFIGALAGRWKERTLLWVLTGAILIQPVEVFYYVSCNELPRQGEVGEYPQFARYVKSFTLARDPALSGAVNEDKDALLLQMHSNLYYVGRWMGDIYTYVPADNREIFTANKFYLFDNTMTVEDGGPAFYQKLGRLWREKSNVAVLPQATLPEDIRVSSSAPAFYEALGSDSRSLKVLSFDANTVKLRIQLDRPRFLLWTRSYHSGWHVFINGREGRLLRADHAFRGVWLPAGESTVLFRFATPLRYAAAYFMLIMFAGALCLIVLQARREGFLVDEVGP